MAWPFVAYTVRLVELFASLGAPAIATGPVSPFLVGLYYAVLLAVGLFFSKIRP